MLEEDLEGGAHSAALCDSLGVGGTKWYGILLYFEVLWRETADVKDV